MKREPQEINIGDAAFTTESMCALRATLGTVATMTPIRRVELFWSDYERLRRAAKARKADTMTYRGITLVAGRMRRGREDGSLK